MIKHYCDKCGKELSTWEYRRLRDALDFRVGVTIETKQEDGEYSTSELCPACFQQIAIAALNL